MVGMYHTLTSHPLKDTRVVSCLGLLQTLLLQTLLWTFVYEFVNSHVCSCWVIW